ncbi:MAG: hypothetical protein HUK18_07810 [Bacteroidales bacterium]|nr:hypothetical protein [Bacteroidales bacterium]
MRTEIEKIHVLSTELAKAEAFVEDICSQNHLYNYFGSISIALSTAMSLVKGKVSISYEKCVGGVVFSISSKEEVFKAFDFENIGEENTNALFLIDTLADRIEIKDKGRTIELIFLVNGIEPELALQRQEAVRKYSSVEVLIK